MTTLLLAHGWGFEATIWDGLRTRLAASDTVCAEAGYFGARPAWPCPAPGYVAVGHSAGFGTLLDALPPGCAGLVAINGFTRFTAGPDFPAGVAARPLERMLSRLENAADEVVSRFRARCGLEPDEALRPDVPRLRHGLERLRDRDVRARLARSGLPVLALAAQDDPVVTPAHARACFPADSIQWSGQGGHLLPLTRPDWCAEAILEFAS